MAQKVAVITGSHKGLGYAIARRLAHQDNIQLVLTSRREQDGLAAQGALLRLLSLGSVLSPLQSWTQWSDHTLGKGTTRQ
jgi:NAD(P)-dependent dehydrogenase (short-subunit alcohol dehydrogenase family)